MYKLLLNTDLKYFIKNWLITLLIITYINSKNIKAQTSLRAFIIIYLYLLLLLFSLFHAIQMETNLFTFDLLSNIEEPICILLLF